MVLARSAVWTAGQGSGQRAIVQGAGAARASSPCPKRRLQEHPPAARARQASSPHLLCATREVSQASDRLLAHTPTRLCLTLPCAAPPAQDAQPICHHTPDLLEKEIRVSLGLKGKKGTPHINGHMRCHLAPRGHKLWRQAHRI